MKMKKPKAAKFVAPKVSHPIDALVKVEPKLDAKLEGLDPHKLKKLRRIARLEREFTGGQDW